MVPSSAACACPFELKHDPDALAPTLTEAARAVGGAPGDLHAVTMTAELSQAFRTKREGVGFVLDALEAAFPAATLHVYTVEGRFVTPLEARALPLSVGAANWAATARLVARSVPTCILLDIGTTSADLIPIVNGQVVVQGHTDPERLLSGELVYTGALRTPAEAVAPRVPLWGGSAGVSADGFALIGDAHLWLGRLSPEDYTCRTPDGRPAYARVCRRAPGADRVRRPRDARRLGARRHRPRPGGCSGPGRCRGARAHSGALARHHHRRGGRPGRLHRGRGRARQWDWTSCDWLTAWGSRPAPLRPPRWPGFSGIPWNRVDEPTLGRRSA